MKTRITQQQLESYLWGAATLLRGTIDAGDYKQFIFPLLFYKRLCDVFDEETQAALKESGGDAAYAAYPENHRFQIPPEAHWREVRKVSTNVGAAIQNAMRAIETANPDKLYGIFGDAQWTNKDRLSDAMLRDLIEHFSRLELTVANLPEDELGNGYEYLIKKFADDSGHTAAEFYTNRTVVHLMTELLEPQPGESIYDPTCGSGGMLLSAIAHLKRQGKEWRNVRLYGQERNLMTSSIARMNCFLHGVEDFQIARGDTLSDPKFVEGDRLMQFDVVLANPPYSIKQWDREGFASDPWGRNLYGTPPQGRADYAFQQHILASLKVGTGRSAILWPHGILFRQEEAEIRRKIVEADLIEVIIGLGPNLFYNSSMESCVVICRTNKPKNRKGKILFVNAAKEVVRERTQSFLRHDHIYRIVRSFRSFQSEDGFAAVAPVDAVRQNDYNLKIDLYVGPANSSASSSLGDPTHDYATALRNWGTERTRLRDALAQLSPGLTERVTVQTSNVSARASIEPDRSEWVKVKFGEVVRPVRETIDPSSGEVERYIAGDHMDSEDVHLRRWGTVGDAPLGPAFVRRFKRGQVLYGSRRTYLKKVALADFDGVTANTTFVLEPKSRRLHAPLLPWIMLSNGFTEHSVRNSKGSTNPYINFSDIASYELNLPPLPEQERLAAILWAADGQLNSSYELLITLRRLRESLTSHLLCHGVTQGEIVNSACGPMPARWKVARLGELLEPTRVPVEVHPETAYREVGIRSYGKGIFHKPPTPGIDIGEKRVFKVEPGRLMVNIVFAWEGAIAITSEAERDFIASHRFPMYVSRDSRVNLEFLLAYLLSERGLQAVGGASPGGAGRNRTLGQKEFFRIPVPLPEQDEQLAIVHQLRQVKELCERGEEHYARSRQLRSALTEQLLAGEVVVH